LIKAIFFDVDGTLVDSNELHVQAWAHAFSLCDVPVVRAAIRQQIGKGADMLIPAILPDAPVALRKALERRHADFFRTHGLERVRPFPGATEAIKKIVDRKVKVVLASSASNRELQHYVRLLRIESLVESTSADDVAHSKPAPDIFSKALQKVVPITPKYCLAVGDTPYDVESALQCGVRTIGVRTGPFSARALLTAGAIAVKDSVAKIAADLDIVLRH